MYILQKGFENGMASNMSGSSYWSASSALKLNNIEGKLTGVPPHCFSIGIVNVYVCCVLCCYYIRCY